MFASVTEHRCKVPKPNNRFPAQLIPEPGTPYTD